MARYQIILAYDGTDFLGSQRQASSRTVQSELEKALRKIGWQGKSILLAGRTDTGTHASGQVAAFDLDWGHGLDELHRCPECQPAARYGCAGSRRQRRTISTRALTPPPAATVTGCSAQRAGPFAGALCLAGLAPRRLT